MAEVMINLWKQIQETKARRINEYKVNGESANWHELNGTYFGLCTALNLLQETTRFYISEVKGEIKIEYFPKPQ